MRAASVIALSGAGFVASLASLAWADSALVPFPHPLISEVLYAVPTGPRGDANADGTRDAIGDEFIEIVNPHDRPIQLKGYTLMDSDAYAPGAAKPSNGPRSTPNKPGSGGGGAGGGGSGAGGGGGGSQTKDTDKQQWTFTFPELELKPGQVAVVFNGYKSSFTGPNAGPCGGPGKAPTGVNDRFHNAYVFSIANTSPYAALGNDGDFVLLTDASGKPVQAVKWGKASSTKKKPPAETILVEDAPVAVGSVQREGGRGKLLAHKDLSGDLAGSFCSPGMFQLVADVKPKAKPDTTQGQSPPPPTPPPQPPPPRSGEPASGPASGPKTTPHPPQPPASQKP